MKNILIALIFIGVVTMGIYYFSSPNTTASPEITDNIPSQNVMEPNTTEDLEVQIVGTKYADPNGVFTIVYPDDYVQDEQGEGQYIRIYKRGESERSQSEITDGVVMVFEVIDLQGQTLEEWVDTYTGTLTPGGAVTVTEQTQPVTINNYPGFTFKAQGLGESTYTYIQKDANSPQAVGITYQVDDPEGMGIQQEVDGIINTITLLK